MPEIRTKIIIVLGPTATGKSALAVRLARAVGGEIISADSRQVYRGLDIGSGKITAREMRGVPHHLLNVVSPKRVFTVAQFQKLGQEAVKNISSRRKVPIVCGGAGFFIKALVDTMAFPAVPPNRKLRARLEKKTADELRRILKKLDSRRLAEIDGKNPRRLMRAIEISRALGGVPRVKKNSALYNPLYIGLTLEKHELHAKIRRRLRARLRRGMIDEVRKLRKNGVSWRRLESFGLEYRAIAEFLQGKIDREKMAAKLETNIRQYAKRQMTWFKKDKRIRWHNPSDWAKIKASARKFLAE